MAGVKGRCGGSRPNSGGARPNSGPSHKDGDISQPINASSPLEFLLQVMNDEKVRPSIRVRAAIAAARYEHALKSEGKKEKQQEAAEEIAVKSFANPLAPPKLRVVR